MIRLPALLALIVLLAGCTQPVPPGAQVAILHPPSGTLVPPDPVLLVAGQAWGPGFHTEVFGGDTAIDAWSVPIWGLSLEVAVDGQPMRWVPGVAAIHRVRLGGLAPGRHEISVSGGGLRRRIVLQVADPPPIRFMPARDRTAPAPPAEAVEALARAIGIPHPELVSCGDGAFLTMRKGTEFEVHRLGPEGHRAWRWTTAAVARQASRFGLEIDTTPGVQAEILCFGEAAAVLSWAARNLGGGRFPEGRYAVLLSVREPMRLVLMPPEGGWKVLDMQGRLLNTVAPATAAGRGRYLLRLGDGRWWVLLDHAIAPLEDGRPAVALPLPPEEGGAQLGRPLPYMDAENLRPSWHPISGWPPQLEAGDSLGSARFVALAGTASLASAPDNHAKEENFDP